MLLSKLFTDNLQRYFPAPSSFRFLLAISGGLDSVVLAHLSREAGLTVTLAHCNFQLRGGESERDEAFVRELAREWNLPLLVKRFDTRLIAVEQGLSIQEAARRLRYQWFEEQQHEGGFDCTLLAHHADDNLETVLMNFFRGTGLQGLTGMPEHTTEGHRLFRPLMPFRRTDLEQYANENSLRWVEDSSNASTGYTRNFFRLEVIPALRKVFPQVEENVLSTMDRLRSVNNFYREAMEALKKKVMIRKGAEHHLPVRLLKKFAGTPLIFEIIREFGFGEKQVAEVRKLMEASTGRYIRSHTHQIIRHRLWLVIAPLSSESPSLVIIPEGETTVSFPGGRLVIEQRPVRDFQLQRSSSLAQLDARHLRFPLVLRRAKAGDYFYPLGMPKKKKIARFLIDLRLSKSDKENVWVVESEGRIVWVAGHRIDDRFKITEATVQVMILKISS